MLVNIPSVCRKRRLFANI